MNREIVERFANMLARFALWMGADDKAHGPLTLTENAYLYMEKHFMPEIERLLAEERERFVFERVPTIEEAIKEICKTLRPLDTNIEVQLPYLWARLKQLIGRAVRAEREKVREIIAEYVGRHWVSGNGEKTYPYVISSSDVPQEDLVLLGNAIRQLDLTAPSSTEEGSER